MQRRISWLKRLRSLGCVGAPAAKGQMTLDQFVLRPSKVVGEVEVKKEDDIVDLVEPAS